jgi:hypothetical protein
VSSHKKEGKGREGGDSEGGRKRERERERERKKERERERERETKPYLSSILNKVDIFLL